MTVMPSSLLIRRRASITMDSIAQVERGDRLVGEQDLGLLHQRAGDRDALLLPAGELVGAVQRMRHHVQALQRTDGEGPVLRREQEHQRAKRAVVADAAHQDIGHDREPRHQVELLEHHRALGAPAAHPTPLQRADIDIGAEHAVAEYPPRRRVRQPVDHPQQRRLSRTRAPDDPDHLPLRHRDRHVVHRDEPVEGLGQVFDLENQLPSFRSPPHCSFAAAQTAAVRPETALTPRASRTSTA